MPSPGESPKTIGGGGGGGHLEGLSSIPRASMSACPDSASFSLLEREARVAGAMEIGSDSTASFAVEALEAEVAVARSMKRPTVTVTAKETLWRIVLWGFDEDVVSCLR